MRFTDIDVLGKVKVPPRFIGVVMYVSPDRFRCYSPTWLPVFR
jgi:hypothetical protein